MDSREFSPLVIRFGPFVLDGAAGELREQGVLRRLHPQAFRVLQLLASRPGQIVTRQEIRYCLWGERKYVDHESGINLCINQIRAALHDSAQSSRYILTLPRRGYRFADASMGCEPPQHAVAPAPPPPASSIRLAALFLAAAFAVLVGDTRATLIPDPLPTKQTVVVAEFVNMTGDALFDGALKHALSAELQQSPFLNVLPEWKSRETFKLMGLAAGQPMTAQISREMCLRTGSGAVIGGAISALGSHYLLSVNGTACGSGAVLGQGRAEAVGKDQVLKALNHSVSQLRTELGESLSSVQKFDTPVEATTTSLEALQSFSVGIKVTSAQGDAPSIPFFKRAIELDPNFALAYVALATRYNNLNQPSQALQYSTKAYELRDRVSERERLVIESRYFRLTGELEKHTQILEMWIAEYPRDAQPHGSLGVNYAFAGQYEKAREEWLKAAKLNPDDVSLYENLAQIYLAMNRPEDAQSAFQLASARKLESGDLHLAIYQLAFVQRDFATMQRQLDWALGRPGSEDILLSAQSDTEAYFGRMGAARALSRRAAGSAIRCDYKETAALWEAYAALRDAEFGETTETRGQVAAALALDSGRNVKVFAALAFARAGDTGKAEALVHELEADFPADSILLNYRLPSIRAIVALHQGNPARALELLEPAVPYDLVQPSPSGVAPLYPAYLRGQAYLSLHNGAAAAKEFQKILDHPGIAINYPLAVLAHLQLARAAVLSHETARARTEYLLFLTTWKDADPGIPVLRAAKTEFAKLNLRAGRIATAPRFPALRRIESVCNGKVFCRVT